MIITKEQQEAWIDAYIKQGHNQDECIGFIDGIEKVMSIVKNCNAPDVSKSEGIEGKPTVCLTCKFNKPNNAICDFCNDNANKYSRQTVC